jgi:hypothetical protein
MVAMRRPRFQFRLWMIFALTALVGWGIVAVPYWFKKIGQATMSEAEREWRHRWGEE